MPKDTVLAKPTKKSDKHDKPDKSDKHEKSEKSKSKDVKETKSKPEKVAEPDNQSNNSDDKGLTKDAIRANLHFNPNALKRWLKNFYELNGDPVYLDIILKKQEEKRARDLANANKDDEPKSKSKDTKAKDTKAKDTPKGPIKIKIANAQFAITASEETLCLNLIEIFSENLKKNNNTGLYEMTYDKILGDITQNESLNFTFFKYLKKYDRSCDYLKQLYDNAKDQQKVLEYIDKYGFKGSGNAHNIETTAKNFIFFLLFQNRVFLAKSAYTKMKYANKSSIDFKAILLSLEDHYQDKLLKSIKANLEDKFRNIGIKVLTDKPDKKKSDKSDKTDKKESKKSEKKAEPEDDESDSDSDEEDDDAESDDDASASESESDDDE